MTDSNLLPTLTNEARSFAEDHAFEKEFKKPTEVIAAAHPPSDRRLQNQRAQR
jgi:hypothetical protein